MIPGLFQTADYARAVLALNAELQGTPADTDTDTDTAGFRIYDDRLVIVEMINAQLWLDDPANVALYAKTWEWLDQSAVRGAHAHRLIVRAREALRTS